MHGTWSDFTFALIICGILVYLPGFILARALNIRGFLSIGVAPIISISLISTTAVMFGSIGIPWTIVGLFIVFVLVTVFALIIRVLFNYDEKIKVVRYRETFIPTAIALFTGGVFFARVLYSLKVPYAISQTYDANYHYNSVASMLESGDLSSLHMLQLPPNSSFYPAAWHDFVTSVIHVTGVSIPVAANAFTYFLLCFVWPLSMLTFALCISKNKVFLSAVATVSTLIAFFPGVYLWFGMLYANVVASSFLPAVLMVVVAFLFRQNYFQWWQSIILGIASFLGLVFSQPNGIFTVYYVVLIVLPFAAYYFGKDLDKGKSKKNRILFVLLAIVADIALEIVVGILSYNIKTLYNLRFDYNVIIGAPHGYKSGILAFLTARFEGYEGSLLPYLDNLPIAVLVFLGLFLVLRNYKKSSWVILAYLWFSFINFVAGSLPTSLFRTLISGVYYSEKMRLISIQAIFMVIFVAISVLFIFEKIKAVKKNSQGEYSFKLVTIAGLVLVFVAGNFVPYYASQFEATEGAFSLPKDNTKLGYEYSKEEIDFMARTIKSLDKNYTVTGNPWKGATATWYLFGHKNPLYHAAYPSDKNQLLIIQSLNKANENPKVCEAVKALKLKYVYSLSGKCLWERNCDVEGYQGLADLEENNVAKLLDQDNAGNKLYEITACK